MRINALLSALLLSAMAAFAQSGDVVNIQLQARADYQREYVDGESVKGHSGFKGQYLNLCIGGDINRHFSYFFRQRLNKTNFDSEYFDATDMLYMDYKPNENWLISAGKQVVAIGGWEYDRAPIDLYFCSEFWNQVPCYQWGASVAYVMPHDKIMAQFCQSPFRTFGDNSDIYAYNVLWSGKHGVWSPLWSVNMQEWRSGRFINYLALGNAFDLGRVRVEFDFMNRASSHQRFLFDDFSIMGEVAYRPIDKISVFAHASYDVNKTHTECDKLVMAGTDITRLGCGLEFFPVKKYDIRLHADYCYTWGRNTNPDGISQDKQSIFNVGLTWKVTVFKH